MIQFHFLLWHTNNYLEIKHLNKLFIFKIYSSVIKHFQHNSRGKSIYPWDFYCYALTQWYTLISTKIVWKAFIIFMSQFLLPTETLEPNITALQFTNGNMPYLTREVPRLQGDLLSIYMIQLASIVPPTSVYTTVKYTIYHITTSCS